MSETAAIMLAWTAGGGLGAMFFGGLWWTVREGTASARPALWFFCSLALRMSLALVGFHLVSGQHWERLLACLLGFVMARVLVIRSTREAAYAPEP